MLDIKTVYECNRCLGCKTLHPQVSLINLESPNLEQEAVKFEFYAILLIEDCPDGCYCCGRKYYDYSNATMVFLTPGEIFRMSENNTLPNKGYLLAFHPDLLFHTSLDNPIKNYTFFAYHKEEALTRENKNKAILEKLERLLDEYIISGKLENGQLPTAEYCTAELDLSVAYFNDLLRFETGKTLEEYFQFKRLSVAKTMLLKNGNTPALVARQLGYPNVQYFSLIFKKITGIAPCEYPYAQN